MTTLAALLLVVGVVFAAAGVVGYARFPDFFTRTHAAGKVGVLAGSFFFLAAALVVPGGGGRGLLGAVLLALAGPVASHALARAAWRSKKRRKTVPLS